MLVAFWAVLTPMFDAPDEYNHLNSAVRLTEDGGWPAPGEAERASMINAATTQALIPAADRSSLAELQQLNPGYAGLDQMTQHPPLYYAYVAVVLKSVDFMDLRSDHSLLVARLAGLVFVLPLPLAAWDTVRRLTGSPRAGLIAAASLLAVPQLAHIMGSVSNDSLAIAASAVTIWLGVRIMTGDRSWRATIGIGIALALALLSKGTTLPLIAYVAAVLIFWPQHLSLRQRILRSAAGLATAFLGGWWWARNLLVHGALQPNSTLYETQPWDPDTGPSAVLFTEYVWTRVTRSFWGNFGGMTYPLPQPLTDTLTVICLAVVVAYAFRRTDVRVPAMMLAGVTMLLTAAFLARTWSGYVRTQLPAGMQGRYFFVLLIALIALSAIGWRILLPTAERTRACIGLLASFAIVAAAGIAVMFRDAYSGFADWLVLTPLGAWGTGALGLATAGCCLAALVLCIQFVRANGPQPLTASLDSESPEHRADAASV